MVVHRTCSFCAGEIEPGTGQLYVKRDGSMFSFCSSSCRKQQLGLGRVGHRLRWTHAHELKRLAEQRRQPAPAEAPAAEKKSGAGKGKGTPKGPAPGAAPSGASEKAAAPKSSRDEKPPASGDAGAAPKKPRARKKPAASDSS